MFMLLLCFSFFFLLNIRKNKYFFTFIFLFFVHTYEFIFIKYQFCKEKNLKSCTFAMKSCKFAHTDVLGGMYPLCISVPTSYHTSVGEFATFHSKCATFQNIFSLQN